MSEVLTDTSTEEQSPRSTVLLPDAMTAGVLPGMIGDGGVSSPEDKDSPDKTQDTTGSFEDPLSALPTSVKEKNPTQTARESERATPTTPLPYEYSYGSYQGLTPQQQRSAYGYTSYPLQTPEPASPVTHGHVYDVGSFLQPIGAFHPATGTSTFLGHNGISPTRMTPIPPPSPLFPRATTLGSLDSQSNQPPVLPYMSPPLGSGGVTYHGYPSPRTDAWDVSNIDRNSKAYALSPQLQGYRVQQGSNTGRSYSVEDAMLPPPTPEDQAANPAYSPYAGSQGSAYSMISSWPYGGPGDPYSAQPSPLQPRPTTAASMGMYPGARAVYGQYYPSTSPGPPIQTTACNKGPDGANLFIFHIPNHFTNYDMYQLFDPYGTLLSVRIMVEKDTGRSRGFGFVSYDSPESAALAIKELNGFAIGNKRLKVQHKQIRRNDVSDRDPSQESYEGVGSVYPVVAANYNTAQGELWLDAVPVDPEKTTTTAPLDDLGPLQNALPDVTGVVAEGSS